MNANSSLAARPVARPDGSINETRQQIPRNRGNYAVTETTLKLVSETVNLKAGTRVLDVAAGAWSAAPAAPPRFRKVTSPGYLPTLLEGAKHRADGERQPSDLRRAARTASRYENWRRRSEKWRCLMVAAQGGQSQAYEQLLRELDAWLRRYYASRLPCAAAEDAKQDALLAIHASRRAYAPSRPFGPWVAAIARYKWIDHVRDASRHAAQALDHKILVQDQEQTATIGIAVDDLLGQLKPAQARVIRLVKLQGVSIKGASCATGQSAALVKVNVHRGLKKLAAVVAATTRSPPTDLLMPRAMEMLKHDANQTRMNHMRTRRRSAVRRPNAA
jgi:RNA polymerase sigma factor (sigma-70 family)